MKFGGKADVKGFFTRMSNSIGRHKRLEYEVDDKSSAGESDSKELEVEAMAQSFINDDQLRNFNPGMGTANLQVLGESDDGALDINFHWEESDAAGEESQHKKASTPPPLDPVDKRPSAELVLDKDHSFPTPALKRHGGRKVPISGKDAVKTDVPRLSIVMLVCGTRGDVQPFIALGLKMKEYGHRIRIATHKDYRKFVTDYELEFYPLGGDPKILSDFIVKHRGVFTVNTKDAFENIDQVEAIVFSSYDACTKPDPEDPQKRSFVAQAIIANPPSYGHIHCAEKLRVPLHIYFTMPWTPTRNYPHPLSRMQNVRDTRPSSVAIRNYLSYIVVNEYTYTGLSNIFNRFRKEKLHLAPIRYGNSGATLLDFHSVPFSYCWSPSLVPKPDDWDEYINVTGYFFLNEGVRGSYKPPKELADFLAAGPPPVYLGFGSLIVDDRERVTQKILDAFIETGQRLLLSKGWANLGEGFDLPDTVMLLVDTPHDWLLPKCSAVVHHGGAGTTAAGLIAACPTTVIPFFGDQTFWGSAVYRRGVGPRPIPIDSLTTKKLVEALTFMQRPEVKREAEKVSALIQQEDGVSVGMDFFHERLPVEKLLAGKPIEWNLSKPSLSSFFYELGGGVADLFVEPYKGAQKEGFVGAMKGMGLGVQHVISRPIKGVGLAGYSVWESLGESKLSKPKCFMPQHSRDDLSSLDSEPSEPGEKSIAGRRTESEDTIASLGKHGAEKHKKESEPIDKGHSKPAEFKRTYSFRMVSNEPSKEATGEELGEALATQG